MCTTNFLKNQRGDTLITLVIYLAMLIIVIGSVSFINFDTDFLTTNGTMANSARIDVALSNYRMGYQKFPDNLIDLDTTYRLPNTFDLSPFTYTVSSDKMSYKIEFSTPQGVMKSPNSKL